ncbi:hypothetical protein [Paenibacillus taiwanensis]|uniref:hypothetical protein n=1 Tax=Paenibacillus taiwanensis TaxID=401638 RepID=UPI00041B2BF1|nr:hypothetical protein [Paenibacillus taiwanensis]
MNLADMLSYADIQQLARIARQYDCECNSHSKHELIQSILSAVGSRDIFEHQVDAMSLEELRFLNSLLFDERAAFSLEELISRVQQTRFDSQQVDHKETVSPRDTIVKFKHSGWLFNGCSQQTKYLFQVPDDLKRRFRDVLYKRFQHQLVHVHEPEAYRDEDGRLGEDLIELLRFVQTETVPLNNESVMYKKTQQQLLECFAVKEAVVQKGEWRFGYGRRFHDYPNRMSLIYDYAFYQGWLEEMEGFLRLTATGQERLMNGARYEPIQPIYRFWLKLYKNAIPNLLSIVHWVNLCCVRWSTLQSLESILQPYLKPFYYDTPQSIFRERIVRMMVYLGLLRYGEHSELGPLIQVTKRGQTLIHGVYVDHDDKIPLMVDKQQRHC